MALRGDGPVCRTGQSATHSPRLCLSLCQQYYSVRMQWSLERLNWEQWQCWAPVTSVLTCRPLVVPISGDDHLFVFWRGILDQAEQWPGASSETVQSVQTVQWQCMSSNHFMLQYTVRTGHWAASKVHATEDGSTTATMQAAPSRLNTSII